MLIFLDLFWALVTPSRYRTFLYITFGLLKFHIFGKKELRNSASNFNWSCATCFLNTIFFVLGLPPKAVPALVPDLECSLSVPTTEHPNPKQYDPHFVNHCFNKIIFFAFVIPRLLFKSEPTLSDQCNIWELSVLSRQLLNWKFCELKRNCCFRFKMSFRRPPRDVDRMTSLRVGNLPFR